MFFLHGEKMDGVPRPERGAAAVDRALDLFVELVRLDGAKPLSVLAGEIGLPLSTAHRLISPYVRRGLLVRSRPGRYVAGPGLSQLSPPVGTNGVLAKVARPILKRVARETKVNAHLGVLEEDMVTYLVKEGAGRDDVFTREGMQLEAYCSAIGKVLLAYARGDYLDDYLAGGAFIALTPNTVTDAAVLHQILGLVRDRGFALDEGEIVDELNCVAAPVRDGSGAVIAAISLSTSGSAAISDRMLPALLASAETLSARLGWRPASADSPGASTRRG